VLQGLFYIVGYGQYVENLLGWLMTDENMTRLPIAITAFGDILYYRLLNEEGDDEVIEDVSFIDPHTSDTGALAWDAVDFFNDWCCDQDVINDFFVKSKVEAIQALKGPLAVDEMYFYTPALRLGGSDSVDSGDKGNAVVHLDILLNTALNG
jgi:hypothetical protein